MTQPDNKTAAERVPSETCQKCRAAMASEEIRLTVPVWYECGTWQHPETGELNQSDKCRIRELESELIAQRAVAKYRQHLPDCDVVVEHPGAWGTTVTGDICTCGYAQLPQHIRGET